MKKLFDLQTGKYLELGRDWLDGGEYIALSNSAQYNIEELMTESETLSLCYDIDGVFCNGDPFIVLYNNTTHELNKKWSSLFKDCIYGDRYITIEGDPDLRYKTGDIYFAKMDYDSGIPDDPREEQLYANEYVALKHIDHEIGSQNGIEYTELGLKLLGVLHNNKYYFFDGIYFFLKSFKGNLLEEYSKQLRGEEDKLKELESYIELSSFTFINKSKLK